MKTVITNAGIQAVITAENDGPKIKITSVKIGSAIINPTSSMTDVTDFVWQGNSSYLTYNIIDANTFAFKVTLDESVGDFNVGNIGLFTASGDLFCLTSLFAVERKYQTTVSQQGNRREYIVYIQLTQIIDKIDLTIYDSTDASIPTVQTENDLPAVMTIYNCYQVLYHTKLKYSCLAIRENNGWSYIKTESTQKLYNFELDRFDEEVNPGDPVYYDTISNTFKKATANTAYNGYYTDRNNIVDHGVVVNDNWTLTKGSNYYLDNNGNPTTTVTLVYLGIAVDTNVLYLDNKPETILNKVQTIDVNNPSAVDYPSEAALVNYAESKFPPVGTVIESLNGSMPASSGWLLCNGQAVSRTTYAALFAIIGTHFGSGNGTTTFNLPDYRGKFLRGLGGNSAPNIWTAQAEGLPNISGRFVADDNVKGTGSGAFYNTNTSYAYDASSTQSGNGGYLGFQASRSNAIYGASNHVTPENYAVYRYVKY